MGEVSRGVCRLGCLLAALLVVAALRAAAAEDAQEALVYVEKRTAKATFDASMAAVTGIRVELEPWHYIGPFDNAGGKGFSTEYPPEKGIDLLASYAGKGGAQVRWEKGEQFKDGRYNSLRLFKERRDLVVYLYRRIDSPLDRPVPAFLAAYKTLTVWLNGKKVYSRPSSGSSQMGSDLVLLRLRKGGNHLLLKVCQGGGDAGFGFSVDSPATSPAYMAMFQARLQQDFPLEQVLAVLVEIDYVQQFHGLARNIRDREHMKKLVPQMARPDAGIADSDRDGADVVLRRTEAMLNDLASLADRSGGGPAAARRAQLRERLPRFRRQLQQMQEESARTDAAAGEKRFELYRKACRLRRAIAFSNPLLDFDALIFIKRERNPLSEGSGHHMCDQFFGFNARNLPGGGLYALEKPFADLPTLRNLLAGVPVENGPLAGRPLDFGAFLSPELSYDARTVLFAHSQADRRARRWSEQRSYHIFSVQLDRQPGEPVRARNLRQVTFGSYNDFDPCFLPDGRVVFISERRGGFGRCHGRPVPVYTLHTMNPDGSDIATISYHESNEWQPVVNHDGMVVYTRWDYVDRHFNIAHHPWITTPDGLDARAIHGNFPPGGNWQRRPQMEMDLRPIPASRKYVATAAAHHGQAYGSLVIVDPNDLDDGAMGPVRRLTPDARFPESECSTADQPYATPWPLNENYHLCVYDAPSRNYAIYLVDSFGNKELLYRDVTLSCLSPIPLAARRVPPLVPTQASLVEVTPSQPAATPAAEGGRRRELPFYSVHDPDRGWSKPQAPAPDELGEVVVLNVYDAQKPWPAGTQIKQLRIIQVLAKSTPSGDHPAIGIGSQSSARAVLGTVPVEADGSARFLAPVHRPLLFQAIDQHGLAVQSMRSNAYLMRGARLVCQGCHERRQGTVPMPAKVPLALGRKPSAIRPDVDGSRPFSYPRLVQPVLDRNCVKCHAKNAPKAPDLSAGKPEENARRRGWYASYANLAKYGFWYANGGVSHGAFDGSGTTPGKFGAYGSKLYPMLKAGHHDVKLSPQDMHRLTLWLETNTAFYGDYQDSEAQARGKAVMPVID